MPNVVDKFWMQIPITKRITLCVIIYGFNYVIYFSFKLRKTCLSINNARKNAQSALRGTYGLLPQTLIIFAFH